MRKNSKGIIKIKEPWVLSYPQKPIYYIRTYNGTFFYPDSVTNIERSIA